MSSIKILAKVGLLIALYFFVYHVYQGIQHPVPSLGDSWDYHIPISYSILNGSFLNPTDIVRPQYYYPGSAETINAFFLLIGIPLTLSNIFATVVLFFVLWKLGTTFKLDYYTGLLFAVSFVTTNAVVRWLNAVSTDIWIAVFFSLLLILLEHPKKTISYFVKLGFVFGMLIGSKYSAVFLVFLLSLFYIRSLVRIINLPRFIAFLIPFSFFGLFWYIRNYILLQNPFYPLAIFGFPGKELFTANVWQILLSHPTEIFHAVFGEYKLWFFSLLMPPILLIYRFIKKAGNASSGVSGVGKLFFIGFINCFFFLSFPTSEQPWIMVSSIRYSFPAFIPLMLGVFLLAKRFKKEEVLGLIAIGNMFMVTSLTYFPKLTLFYIPLAFLCFYLVDKHVPSEK